MTTSLERVTRSAAARSAAKPLAANDDTPATTTSRSSRPDEAASSATTTRKRKADELARSPKPPQSKKRAKISSSKEPPAATPKQARKRAPETMSSHHSSSGSADASPSTAPRDSTTRKKTHRRKSKEEQPAASASVSRKSRRGSRKDHDTIMKETEGREAQEEQPPPPSEPAKRDTNTGADDQADSLRRFTEDVVNGGMGDPFNTGYLSRLVGQSGLAGLSGLSGHLRVLSGMHSGTNSRLRGLLEQLRVKQDSSVQLIALQDLSELLLVSNEDNLAGQFAPDQFVKELVSLMQPNEFTGEENPEIMLLACRCIANLMEALPAATASVVYGGAVPVLCQKLLEIHFIDLAEQALSTLEKISVDFPSSIVREGGLTACLTYLEFFATSTQRTAVTTAANCCRNIPEDSFATVRDVMPILLNTLASNDQRVVEQASLCVSRIVDSFKYTESKLEELVSADLLQAILRLLLPGSTNMISPHIHTSFLRVLSITSRASPQLSVALLKMNVVDTLYQILTGVSPPADSGPSLTAKIDKNVIMQAIIRTPREQVFETLNVICEILPTVSRDDLMFMNDLPEAGLSGSNSNSCKTSPNDQRLELLKTCPAEVKRFTIILFPTLMHAYTSTVNLSVRQKVLTAQLKMLSNFDADILKEALRDVTFSSHLASILSQQDNPTLITFALQAAELLLKRLGDIYRPQFYREGVTAEIEKLAHRSVEPATEQPQPEVEEPPEVGGMPDLEPADTMELDASAAMHEHAGDTEPDNDDNEDYEEHHDDNHEGHDEDDDDDEDGDDGEHDNHSDESGHVFGGSHDNVHHSSIQDTITLRAKRFVEAYQPKDSEQHHNHAVEILQDLKTLAKELETCYESSASNGRQLLHRLAAYFSDDAIESITSYELMTSGVVDVLLSLLHVSNDQARYDFVKAFMSSKTTTGSTPFSVLLRKLQELLSRNEHFEVLTVNQNAFETNRAGAASMLAKQLRLQLVADDDSGIPKPYRRIMVSIHAIAMLKALDDYLRPRISMVDRSGGDRVTSAMAAYAAAMRDPGLPPSMPSMPALMPSRGARRMRKSRFDISPAEDETSKPAAQGAVSDGPSSSQEQLECADETHIDGDGDAQEADAELDTVVDENNDEEAEPAPVNMEISNAGKVHATTDDGTRIATPSQQGTPVPAPRRDPLAEARARIAAAQELLGTPTGGPSRQMSYASALQSVPQDWHIEFSINGQRLTSDTTIYRACYMSQTQTENSNRSMWSATHTINYKRVEGPPSADSSLTTSINNLAEISTNSLPPSLSEHPITAQILRMMSILHDLNSHLDEIIIDQRTDLTTEPLTRFVNAKLTAKLNRQLEEPLIVASNCLPAWSEDLARLYGFLFPFESRHLFLSSTSFGYSRSMTRWQNSQQAEQGRRRHHRDERPFLGRLQRQKVRIARHRVLESAIKVMELYGSAPAVLEIEWSQEVGTGLGPTLEFYSMVSKEFSRRKTKLWRENDVQGGDFAFGRRGLFPAPMTAASSTTETGKKVLHLFKMLGKFVARAMMDSRLVDIAFNPAFFRIGMRNGTQNLAAVSAIDQDLARSLKVLRQYADLKMAIEGDDSLDATTKAERIGGIAVNGAQLDDLALDFTLPGYEKLELIPNGFNISVTIDNVAEYIDKVVDLTLGSGVRRQLDAFVAGFNHVFPFDALRAFTPDELVMLFGHTNEDWSLETLTDSVKADHGYNMDSKSVRNLLQVMSELSEEDKRAFLQFVTGSPKLPIGGFKSLTPMFTVVCKPAEAPLTSDDYLPSVMTCVNYLKMPDYSNIDILREKLRTAVLEGQGSFHLS